MDRWDGHRWSRVSALLLAVGLLCLVALSACGGGGASADKADIGQTLSAEGWDITLTGPADTINVVGKEGITYQAQGIYQVVPVEVQNTNDSVLLFPPDLALLRDASGEEFATETSTIHFAYLQDHSDIDLLIDSPVNPDEVRDTVLIFDVPNGAEGLVLTLSGVDDSLNIGY